MKEKGGAWVWPQVREDADTPCGCLLWDAAKIQASKTTRGPPTVATATPELLKVATEAGGRDSGCCRLNCVPQKQMFRSLHPGPVMEV